MYRNIWLTVFLKRPPENFSFCHLGQVCLRPSLFKTHSSVTDDDTETERYSITFGLMIESVNRDRRYKGIMSVENEELCSSICSLRHLVSSITSNIPVTHPEKLTNGFQINKQVRSLTDLRVTKNKTKPCNWSRVLYANFSGYYFACEDSKT